MGFYTRPSLGQSKCPRYLLGRLYVYFDGNLALLRLGEEQ